MYRGTDLVSRGHRSDVQGPQRELHASHEHIRSRRYWNFSRRFVLKIPLKIHYQDVKIWGILIGYLDSTCEVSWRTVLKNIGLFSRRFSKIPFQDVRSRYTFKTVPQDAYVSWKIAGVLIEFLLSWTQVMSLEKYFERLEKLRVCLEKYVSILRIILVSW